MGEAAPAPRVGEAPVAGLEPVHEPVYIDSPPSGGARRAARVTSCLQAAAALMVAYLCIGEFVPAPWFMVMHIRQWQRQQVVIVAGLSLLAVILASADARGGRAARVMNAWHGGLRAPHVLLGALNVVPLAAAVVAALCVRKSSNCDAAPYAGAPRDAVVPCSALAFSVDAVGLVSARLARFDLGLSLLLATRGESGWLLRATGGWLGLPEAVPLHRIAGWWCAAQAGVHSLAYPAFYLITGGWSSVWWNCFPAATPAAASMPNRMGLVNFFGVAAFVAALAVVIPALPRIRKRWYHVFQRLHLPASVIFVMCTALHDLPILLFAAPGIADWYLGWRRAARGRALPATARLLPGTSGPWVKLDIDCTAAPPHASPRLAPRGEWALIQVLPLGSESHPLSVAVSVGRGRLSALVSAGAGDWSKQLAALTDCEVTVADGPYPVGGGDWSLQDEPSLLLVAGGTGLYGWLPVLAAPGRAGRDVHLVWCVRTTEDYAALAGLLPPRRSGVRVSVWVTRGSVAATALSKPMREGGGAPTATARSASVPASASVWVSFCATLAALAALSAWGLWVVAHFDPSTSAMEYTLVYRLLPIAAILAALVLTTTVGNLVVGVAFTRGTKSPAAACAKGCPDAVETSSHELDAASDLEAGERTPLLGSEDEGAGRIGAGPEGVEGMDTLMGMSLADTASGDVPTAGRIHICAGRPDLETLVRDALQVPAARLVVAACGPLALVDAARTAVESVRRDTPGTRICFSGVDPNW